MDPRKQPEEDNNVAIAEQDDQWTDIATEQDDVLAEQSAEDDYQLKQEIDREQSGTQIIAESNAGYQDWLTGEEEKLWAFEHEKPDIEEEEPVDISQRHGPTQKTCTKCQKKFMQFFGGTDSIGNYCNECGGLLVDTSESLIKNEAEHSASRMQIKSEDLPEIRISNQEQSKKQIFETPEGRIILTPIEEDSEARKLNEKKKDLISEVSLWLGLASIFLWGFSIVPILAIIFGVFGIVRKEDSWKATVGIALGILFLVVRIATGSNPFSSI